MIRLAVSEQGFVEFCMANRERLLNLGDAVSEKFSTAKTADTTQSVNRLLLSSAWQTVNDY